MFGNDGGREEKQSEAKLNRRLDVNQPGPDLPFTNPLVNSR